MPARPVVVLAARPPPLFARMDSPLGETPSPPKGNLECGDQCGAALRLPAVVDVPGVAAAEVAGQALPAAVARAVAGHLIGVNEAMAAPAGAQKPCLRCRDWWREVGIPRPRRPET